MATAPSMLAPTTPEVTPLVTPLTPSSPSNFLAPVSAGVSDNLANQSDSLLSTPLLVNPEAANFSFSDQDTSWTGTPQVTQLDDLGEVLVVPGNPSERVNMVVQWTVREADFNNEVGFFLVDASGRVEGIAPGEEGFAEAALSSPSRQTLFNSGNQAGNWREFTVAGGSRLGFYVIQNDTSANWLENNRQNQGQSGLAFFSLKGANPDNFDHSQSSHLGRGIWRLNWEDLTGGGDQDFNDVVFNIAQAGIVLAGDKGQQVPLTVEAVSQDNTFPNEMGYYLVDTPDGEINGIKPGDQGYLDAALSGDRHQVIFASGKGFDSKTFNVPSGKYLGWYLVANGTTEQAIAKGENAPPVFFSYAAANEDGLNHVHAQQDSQTWAWEDFWGGGDRDFNDLVFRFSFGEPIGEPIQLPSLSIENTTVTEGNTGTQSANFTVRLSAPTNTTVTAQFTTKDGTAQAGTDYESSTEILTFAPGEVEKNIAVAVKGDTISEPTETFTVNLTGVTNAILIQGEGIGTILDNDNSPNPPDNNPPVTDADKTITLPEDSQPIPLNINPPTDIDGDTLTVSITQLPDNTKGKITLADGTVINVGDEISINSLTSLLYTPLADVNGNGGNFVYTVSDGKGGSDSQTISFIITPENTSGNNSPVTDADKTITLPEDSQPIPLNINPPTDIDGDTLTVSITQLPDNSKGKITLADGTVINVGDEISINSLTSLLYTPLADVNGNGGNFVYTVSDGKGGNGSQTISFIITPVNKASTDIELGDNSVTENAFGATIGNITITDPDTLAEFRNNAVTVNDERFEIVNNGGTFQLKLKNDQSLDYETEPKVTIALTATDGGNTSLTYSKNFTLNVIDVDENIETPTVSAALTNDTGTSDSDRLTLDPTVKGQTTGATSLQGNLNGNGFVDISNALNDDGSFTISFEQYNLLSNGSFPAGDYTLELKARNSSGQESQVVTVSFTLDWTAPPLSLVLAPESDTGEKGDNVTTAYKVNLIGQTEPGLEVMLVETQQKAVADETGAFRFNDVALPSAGKAPYSLIVSDAAGNQGRAQEFLTREGINGAPEITSTPVAQFDQATQVTYAYQVEAIDPDGDELSYRLINAPSGAKIDGNGLLTFTPSGNTTPFYDFKVEVGDGRGGVETQTFTVEVLGVGEGLGTIRGMKWEDLNGDGKRSFYSALFRTNGTASIIPSATTEGESYINLTRATGNQFGTAFLNNSLDIVDGNGNIASFSSYFQFSLTNPGGLQGGGDSITFMIAPSNTATRYDGLNNSVAVELDTYNNGAIDDNSNNHVGILINGNRDAIAQTTVSPSFKNGARWNVWIDYNGATQTLEARVSQDLTRPVNPTVSSVVNIPAILNREDVFIGLAASTGGAWAQHDVFAWDFEVKGTEIDKSIDILPNRTIEPGLAGVTVYLDLNDNEFLDQGEPFQVTAEDDPNTQNIDETGRYEFNYLQPGTYVVREIVPDGYIQTAPIGTVLGSMFDGDFNDEDWSSSYLVVSGTPTITEISEDQRLTGGNPGAYRHMIHHWGGGRIIVYHRYEDYTFDPSVRPFDTIDYVEDVRAINISGVIGQGMAIFQGGDIFRMLGRAFGNFDWQTWAVGNLKEEDFFSDFTGNRPDFSENGAPMQFGYWRSNTNNGQRIEHGIDDWSVTLIDSSTNSYLVNLSAGEIVEKIDFGNALAGSVNIAPRIVSNPITTAYIGVPYQYQVAAIDGNGDALTYTLLKAPQGMKISDKGVITWATGAIGSYQVEVQVDDGKGGIVSQLYDLNVAEVPVDEEAPEVALGFSETVLSVGETVNFQISGNDNFGLADLDISVGGESLTLNPANIERGTIYTASFTPDKPGIFEVLATATDFGGNKDTETLSVRVLDPNDTSAPIAQLDISDFDPLNLVIREKTEIKGTINDQNLEFYRVELAPVSLIDLGNPAAKDPDYITIAEGTGNIDGILASIDPALYRNDNYFVRIYAQDINGNVTVEGFGVGIDSQTKPGEFSLDFTDLSIPLTGIPIEVTRRYSSLGANFQGDFGYGWELGLQDAQIVESAPTGVDLSEDNGLFGNSFTEGTRVTLTTPDGRRVGFTFTPEVFSPSAGIFLGPDYYAWRPKFTPDPGVYETLEVPYVPIMRLKDGSFGIYLFGTTYNPRDYILTTKDGTKYSYSQVNGLQKVEDRNSNTLTFTDNGITSSTGAKIDFIRDAQGRITEIIDPDGKSLKYSYDAKGNLIEFGDRTNNETTFKYEAERDHYLTKVIDPLNRTSVRTEYDDNGQISKIFDADGNALDINYDSATSRQTVKDPFGNTTTYIFDPRGNVVSQIDALAGVTARTYDANNNLLSETDPEGNITSYTYDNRGNKLSETDGEGNTKTFTYNANNDILLETDALGNQTVYTYDGKGNLTKREDAEDNITTYNYSLNGLLTTVTDANGKKSTFKYDNRGNLTELTDPTGAKTTFTYDSNGRVASVTDALGAITNYIYDAQGRLIQKADPEGSSCGCARGITKTEYNAAGEKIAEIDALGRRTEYRYNDRGLLIETILPDSTPDNLSDNPRTQNQYDALDRLTGFIDELGRKTIYIYDALGREIEVIYPDSTPDNLTDNPRTKKEYDKAGRKIAEIDELGNRTEFNYDQADRLLTVTNALNQITSYNYDADGRQIAMTDALGRITEYDYDELDRLLTTTYANNTVMTTTYDPLGRVIAETDLAGNTTNYEYDALGRLTAVIDALNQRTEYKYDLVGNLIEQKDANGNITKFEYDSLRRLKATILPGGQRNETIHDKIGNLIKVTDFNGAVTTYKYNERNWLTEKSFSDGTATETFTYTLTGELATVIDNRGMTNYVYDERDRLISRTEPDKRTISYTYDKASNILTLTVPSGTTTYSYDALNRLDTVKDADNGVTDYNYDAVGNLIKTVFPNGVIENQQYDLLNRLTYLENPNDTGIISSYTYTLDAMGNRVKVVENDGRTVEYTYDNLYRLTQEKITDTVAGNKTITYSFDAVGNRLEKVDLVEGKTTYNYDKNDRLLKEILGGNVTQYQYDEKGNLLAKVENGATTTNYEWNAKGELTAVEVTENGETGRIEFEYDHNGIRVAIDVDGEVTRFLIDNNQQQYAQVIEEYQTNGTVNTTYTHGWDLISQDDGANRIYYQVDGLGSTRLMTGNNGSVVVEYDYDAYGNLTRKVGDAENNYLFAGEQFDDAVDGYYLRARYYNPATGRFVSGDPFEGYKRQPVTLNDYLYGNANPVIFIDPSGYTSLVMYSALNFIPQVSLPSLIVLGEFILVTGVAVAVGLYMSSIITSKEKDKKGSPGPSTGTSGNDGGGNNGDDEDPKLPKVIEDLIDKVRSEAAKEVLEDIDEILEAFLK
ncbi:MAG: DUF4114 domain-containing protein [Microcystis sp. LE17-20A]|nr:DUF4114 domain-containing protein [Microcystis sp. LE17-20A]